MLVCKNLKKIFLEGNELICILDDVNFNISKGETVSKQDHQEVEKVLCSTFYHL